MNYSKGIVDDIYNILRHLLNTYMNYLCMVEINLFVLILVKWCLMFIS